ncbi:MAG: heavy-metal-associated domain-containing protein [Gammaproteobacteria bacterium]
MSELLSLNVTGMKCGGCETAVTTKLLSEKGIVSAKASHKENKIEVEYDADMTGPEKISQIITEAGYTVE